MADRITLTGLSVFGRHGVFDHEKRDGQTFLVDISVWLDLSPAAATDDLTRTVHYGELAELAAGIVGGPSRDLIESVAGEIANAVLGNFPVSAVEVTIHKPAAPIPLTFADVSVTSDSTAGMTRAVLSLGSNIGDRTRHLQTAVAALGRTVRAVSSIYRTPPWGGVEQDDFYNIVVIVEDGVDGSAHWLQHCRRWSKQPAGSG